MELLNNTVEKEIKVNDFLADANKLAKIVASDERACHHYNDGFSYIWLQGEKGELALVHNADTRKMYLQYRDMVTELWGNRHYGDREWKKDIHTESQLYKKIERKINARLKERGLIS